MNFAGAVEILELIYFKILDMLLFLSCSLNNYADTVNISQHLSNFLRQWRSMQFLLDLSCVMAEVSLLMKMFYGSLC